MSATRSLIDSTWLIGFAALGEVADVAGVAGESGVEEVCVERDDDIRLRKIVARFDGLSEGELRAFEHIVAIDGLVDVPLGLRIHLQEIAQLVGKSGRRNSWRQDPDTRTLQRFLRAQRTANCAEKCLP